jgi:hypothetical protein
LRDALSEVLKDRDDVVIVVSSDMSHYNPHKKACSIDKKTLSLIEAFDAERLFIELSGMSSKESPCGSTGIVGVMMAARNLGADKVDILKYATSGDVTGDKTAVVGYFSAVIYKPLDKNELMPADKQEKKMGGLLNEAQKKRLLEIARKTIEGYIRDGSAPEFSEEDETLNKEMGAFVTLHKNGQLRGCIGNMLGDGPLWRTVCTMSIQSATRDPRFRPVGIDELDDIDIEISVLSPLEKIDDPKKIVMGKHGVMVRSAFRSGVYLPQVATETGWNREEFMNSLCAHKTGIAADSWKTGKCDIYIFSAEVFGEKEKAE